MSSRIVLPAALIAVGAGMYGFSQDYLAKQQQTHATPVLQVEKEEPINMVAVWVANESLTPRTPMSTALFELVSVPENEAISKGIDPSDVINISDSWILSQPVEKGQWLTTAMYVTPSSEDYLDFALGQEKVPFPMIVKGSSVIGGSVKSGGLVDIIALTKQNKSEGAYRVNSVNIQPILAAKKVLKVESDDGVFNSTDDVTVVLELSRKEVATLIIAKSVASLELHKSAGIEQAALLQANSGDVLPQFKAIAEYRGSSLTVR
ncbi:hypothetical protein ST37_12255 [Vibrio sp. qd031]|uniref:Flp pilus assembly protein CpaB n=1 Tax=Vibrio sp. qd031 TaxID=1603038 RepID=UPI000A0F9A50|nr:Flp pilus assembly protein CpaB [Vibrio sp. qd031]ORT49216.1 hypothetical protein ST37_12255 [Vibrio sp. qd031]